MPDPNPRTDWVQRVIAYLVEIASGKCSITEEQVSQEQDPNFQQVLSGLLLLHEDLQFRAAERRRATEQLEERSRQLRETQARGRIGGWEYDVVRGVLALSDEALGLLGRDRALGPPLLRAVMRRFHRGEAKRLRVQAADVIETGRDGACDVAVSLAEGATTHFHLMLHPEKGEGGRVVKITGTVQDVTARKQAEDQVREREGRLRGIIETMQEGLSEIDLSGRMLSANPRMEQMFGFAPGDMVGLNVVEDLLFPEDRPRLREQLRQRREGKAAIYDQRFRKKSGESFWGMVSASPVFDARGRVSGAFAMVTDITVRKRHEDELTMLRKALDSSGEAVFLTDEQGVFAYINPGFQAMYGYAGEEIIGQATPRILRDGLHSKEEFGGLWQALLNGRETRWEFRNRRKDGTIVEVEGSAIPIQDEQGRIIGFLGIQHDVSGRKRAEEEKLGLERQLHEAQKLDAIGRLAGGVAHDFNNMLTVIRGYSEMLMGHEEANPVVREHLGQIVDASTRSADIVKKLLAFARRQVINPRVVELNDAVANLLTMLGRLIGEDIELVWRPGHGAWSICIDPSQMDQVMVNLIVNARDAIAGVGRITIETANVTFDRESLDPRQEVHPGAYAMIAVSDSGCGMTPAVMEKLFEPFFTTKEAGKGTGLGLATVYGIVKQNHGFIHVYSEPALGSVFKIYLPCVQERPSEEGIAPDSPPAGGSETILLVEDEGSILRLASAILTGAGYQVLAAGTPTEALALVRDYGEEIHLLVTDVVMPEMNGAELMGRVRAGRPALKTLFMSGYTRDVIASHGHIHEGVEFLQKPFSKRDMIAKVREVLDG